ncbi:MAG: DEAD/DEAH box helicase, partial [Anaerolineae bacterium]|nr:DEAD/DEAH box helicase [Anaerolineae bacterium]
MNRFNEDTIEQAAIQWLQDVGYGYIHGGIIAPDEPAAERDSYNEVLLISRLRTGLERINTHIPRSIRAGAVDEAIRRIQRSPSQNALVNNHAFHRLLTEGIDVSYRDSGGVIHDKIWLMDFGDPSRNEFLAVNQFTVTGVNPRSHAKTNRRPDIILFINGLPLVVIELKNAADEHATIRKAFNQLQTYLDDISALFTYNGLLAISDGLDARLGTLTGGWEWFKPWRTVDGERLDPHSTQLETLIRGVFAPEHLLDLLRYFVVFEQNDSGLIKKVAAYHQYHAVNKA